MPTYGFFTLQYFLSLFLSEILTFFDNLRSHFSNILVIQGIIFPSMLPQVTYGGRYAVLKMIFYIHVLDLHPFHHFS